MNTRYRPDPKPITAADILRRLGDIPPDRVLMNPVPGTATAADLEQPDADLCELVDGSLVEKAMGWRESYLACWLICHLNNFVLPRRLGVVSAPDGTFRLFPDLARAPDVAFTSWGRMPGRRFPGDKIPQFAPDLAIEVWSESNSQTERERKRGEYFRAGVRLVWEIDPLAMTVRVYTGEQSFRDLTAADMLDGAEVLPGFVIPVTDLFAQFDPHE